MGWNEMMSTISSTILIPLILAVGSAVLLIGKSYVNRISKSIVAKNELEQLEKINEVRSKIIADIDTIVKAAVGSNMQLAHTMKQNGHKLSEDESKALRNTAIKLIMSSLPPSVTDEGGVMLNIIGGKDRLNSLIEAMMEKYVYEYKSTE